MSLYLGDIEFSTDELPEHITLGGEQSVAVRKYPGGEIDIQILGAFDDAISWEGVLWFTNAMDRAQTLNDARIAGDSLTLQIGNMSCTVVITKFKFTYVNDAYIPYTIEVAPAELLLTVGSGSSTTSKATTQATVSTTSTTKSTSWSTSDVGAAADITLGDILATVLPTSTAVTAAIANQVTHMVGSSDTLWSIAYKYYGDGSKWTTIATKNSITSAIVTAGTKLIIPNPTKTVTA